MRSLRRGGDSRCSVPATMAALYSATRSSNRCGAGFASAYALAEHPEQRGGEREDDEDRREDDPGRAGAAGGAQGRGSGILRIVVDIDVAADRVSRRHLLGVAATGAHGHGVVDLVAAVLAPVHRIGVFDRRPVRGAPRRAAVVVVALLIFLHLA